MASISVLFLILLFHCPGSEPFQAITQNVPLPRQRLSVSDSSTCRGGKSLPNKPAASTSVLHMGLGSFIRKIIRSSSDEDDRESKNELKNKPEDVRAALEAIKADLEAVVSLQEGTLHDEDEEDDDDNRLSLNDSYLQGRSSSGASEPKKMNSPMRYSETIQERILRVKSGVMTEDEKASFLNNALTRPISKDDQNKRPPIRQSIPGTEPSTSNNTPQRLPRAFGSFRPNKTSAGAPTASPSPFPTDSIWNNVIGRSPSSSKASYPPKSPTTPPSKAELDDAAKREYFNLVMNPERFKSYAAMGGTRTPAAPGTKPQTSPASSSESTTFESKQKDEASYNLGLTASKVSETVPVGPKTDKNDLAYRLEVAATLQEQRDAELKARRESDRLAADAAAQAAQEAREAEIRKQQEAVLEKKRLEKERKEREELERKLEEDRKMKEMIERQEEYWKNKLSKEKHKKQDEDSIAQPEDLPKEQQVVKLQQQQHGGMHMIDTSTMNETEILQWRQMEMEREDPHEQEILKEAQEDRNNQRQMNYDRMEQTVARLSRTVPSDPRARKDVSVNAFVEEQARKKAELDQLMEDQQRRLKELSSPLPITKGSKKFVSSSPLSSSSIPKVESKVVKASPTTSSTGLVPQIGKPLSYTYNVTKPSKPPVTGPTLAQLTMKKVTEQKPSMTVENPPAPKNLSLSALTTLKKEEPKSNTTPSDKAFPSIREKTGPIRQQIVPTKSDNGAVDNDDDEEEEFFSYTRTGPNNGMTIQDIMKRKQEQDGGKSAGDKKEDEKRRAKMWGIDIDRFT